MEERKNTNEQQNDTARDTASQEASGQQNPSNNEEKTGITPGQLADITRAPSERGAGGAPTTKRFITGDDGDGQLY